MMTPQAPAECTVVLRASAREDRCSDASGLDRLRADIARDESRVSDHLEVIRPAVVGDGRPVERFVDGSVSNRSRLPSC